MASERIHNEYDATRIANAVDTLAENLAGYTPGSPVTPTNDMKAKLPSQDTGDRIADATEALANGFISADGVVSAVYEESAGALDDRNIGDILWIEYSDVFNTYEVTVAISKDDPIAVGTNVKAYGSSGRSVYVSGIPDSSGTHNAIFYNSDEYGNTGRGGGGGTPSADDVSYDNTESGLAAEDVQDAIDEMNAKVEGLDASDIAFDNTGTGMTADDVQEAIEKLNSNKQSKTLSHAIGGKTTVEGCLGALNSNLSEVRDNVLGSRVSISSYSSSSNLYTCPSDGQIMLGNPNVTPYVVWLREPGGAIIGAARGNESLALYNTTFVRKGQQVYVENATLNNGSAYFIPYR